VQDADITDGTAFLDEVEDDLNILCTLLLNRVGGEIDGADVIALDKSAIWQRIIELLESCRSEQASATPLSTTRYLASALDREMMFWWLEDQETMLSPRNTA
jgi:hypothetical protein